MDTREQELLSGSHTLPMCGEDFEKSKRGKCLPAETSTTKSRQIFIVTKMVLQNPSLEGACQPRFQPRCSGQYFMVAKMVSKNQVWEVRALTPFIPGLSNFLFFARTG